MGYIGCFAPSPTGPLHAGSIAVALASWLDAHSQPDVKGLWRLRMEDVDHTRCRSHWADDILRTLAALGLHWDGPVIWQSQRAGRYEQLLARLRCWAPAFAETTSWPQSSTPLSQSSSPYDQSSSQPTQSSSRPTQSSSRPTQSSSRRKPGSSAVVYPCHCTRQSPKPCRCMMLYPGSNASLAEAGFAWRLSLERQGPNGPELVQPVLRRADGCWSYTFAVVVDDSDGGITHVVRGADLADETPTQLALFAALGLSAPQHYRHIPLVLDEQGRKLSKSQNSPAALPEQIAGEVDVFANRSARQASLDCLRQACQHLGLWATAQADHPTPASCLQHAVQEVIGMRKSGVNND